jgi:hypothetical protein
LCQAAGASDEDFTFSPVQGASPAGTPRSGAISPRFGNLARQLSVSLSPTCMLYTLAKWHCMPCTMEAPNFSVKRVGQYCLTSDMSNSCMSSCVCHTIVCSLCRILRIRWGAVTAATAPHPGMWRASCAPAAPHPGPPLHLCQVRKCWAEQLLMYVFLCDAAWPARGTADYGITPYLFVSLTYASG